MAKTGNDLKKFMTAIDDMVAAFQDVGIPYHFTAGTALGAIRNGGPISHDDDIDFAVFKKDVTPELEDKLKSSIRKHNFLKKIKSLGNPDEGYELAAYHKNGIRVDIFFVYEAEYKGKHVMFMSSYYGKCDDCLLYTSDAADE